jgi:hypothetical protein
VTLIAKVLLRRASIRPTRAARDLSAVTYAGWTITAMPPAVPGAGKFARSPTAPVRIRSADGALLPSQSVTPANPNTRNVRADAAAGNGGEYWPLVASNGSALPVTFTLTLPVLPVAYRGDVEMKLVLAACTPGPPVFLVVVNGRPLKIHRPLEKEWFEQRITIPARFLISGANQIVLSPLGGYYGIWLRAVHFASPSVPISISAQWLQICSGELGPDDAFHRSVPLQQGTAMSESQIRAFAQQFDIGVEDSRIDELLDFIGSHFASRFFFDEGAKGSTSIGRQTTVACDVKIGPAREEGLTFQVWQLAIMYEANGCQLVQALGRNGPIIVRQFPANG